jgi:hypothetical protein
MSDHDSGCRYYGDGDWSCSAAHDQRDAMAALRAELAVEKEARRVAEAERDQAIEARKEAKETGVRAISRLMVRIDQVHDLRTEVLAIRAERDAARAELARAVALLRRARVWLTDHVEGNADFPEIDRLLRDMRDIDAALAAGEG